MPKILRQRPFSWLFAIALYCAFAFPVMWLSGQNTPLSTTPAVPPKADAPPAKAEEKPPLPGLPAPVAQPHRPALIRA